ncbi:MAG TPA: ECF-type sigma factor [Xanthomonadales bacterium]|nr:ECF-type sigma factor [Xanthomonadales bacterium]
MDEGDIDEVHSNAKPITEWLIAARDGEAGSLDQLYNAIYPMLHRMAMGRPGVRNDGTLQPTAVVNELFLKIEGSRAFEAGDREHFFAICSRAMRFIVTDAARQALADKRGGHAPHLTLVTALSSQPDRAQELLDINTALEDLENLDSNLRELVEFKFYGGLSYHEIAQLHDRSERSIKRDWARARAFLVARSALSN